MDARANIPSKLIDVCPRKKWDWSGPEGGGRLFQSGFLPEQICHSLPKYWLFSKIKSKDLWYFCCSAFTKNSQFYSDIFPIDLDAVIGSMVTTLIKLASIHFSQFFFQHEHLSVTLKRLRIQQCLANTSIAVQFRNKCITISKNITEFFVTTGGTINHCKATAWFVQTIVSAVKTMCYLKPSLTSFRGVPSLINLRHKLWEFLMGRSFFWFRFWWLFNKHDVKARQTWELLTALRSIWSQLFRLQSPECAQEEGVNWMRIWRSE